jgi:hypothetical protein
MKKVERCPTLCTQPSFVVRVFPRPRYPDWLAIFGGYRKSAALFTHTADGGYAMGIRHLVLFEGEIESAGF